MYEQQHPGKTFAEFAFVLIGAGSWYILTSSMSADAAHIRAETVTATDNFIAQTHIPTECVNQFTVPHSNLRYFIPGLPADGPCKKVPKNNLQNLRQHMSQENAATDEFDGQFHKYALGNGLAVGAMCIGAYMGSQRLIHRWLQNPDNI